VLFAERVDRRVEREHHERDAGPERGAPPDRDGLPAPRERPRPTEVEDRRQGGGDQLERLEGPGTEKRRRVHPVGI